MLAVVLSGAANYGAMQAGALEVLLEAGLMPEMAVGTSAGSLNAISLAAEPTAEGMRRLQSQWDSVSVREVGMPTLLRSVRQWVSGGEGLLASEPLARFLERNFPQGAQTFADLHALHGVQAYAVAACMETGSLQVFGDDPADRIIDGAMASTALPPFFPPWHVQGKRYLDGGVFAKLPLRAAVAQGATQIVALDVKDAMGSLSTARGIRGVTGYALSLMVEYQTAVDVHDVEAAGIPIWLLELPAPPEVPFWDFNHAQALIERGRLLARQALERRPLRREPDWRLWSRRAAARLLRRNPAVSLV